MSEYFNLPDFNSDLLETAMVKNFVGLVKQEFISYWQDTLHHTQKLEFFLSFRYNKNALSSVESRLLGDLLYYFFVWNTKPSSIICHNVNTQKVKIARKDLKPQTGVKPLKTIYILILLHWGVLFQGFYTPKNWTMIFIGIRGPWLCQYKYT